MKLRCYKCNEDVNIVVEMSGTHLKASCSQCGKYIKFLSKEEKTRLGHEEDAKEITDGL